MRADLQVHQRASGYTAVLLCRGFGPKAKRSVRQNIELNTSELPKDFTWDEERLQCPILIKKQATKLVN